MTFSPRREFFRKLALVGGLAALGSSARVRAQAARDVATQDVTCDNGMPAFLAHPTGGGNFPTVILMHERYGLVQHTRDQAMRCARDGYAVLAPNFFYRHPDQAALNAGNSRCQSSATAVAKRPPGNFVRCRPPAADAWPPTSASTNATVTPAQAKMNRWSAARVTR